MVHYDLHFINFYLAVIQLHIQAALLKDIGDLYN